MAFLKNYFLNLNLFESFDANIDNEEHEHKCRSNIISTRVYLIIVLLALIILAVSLWLSIQTTIITIEHPSKTEFEVLPFDANCPCSRISISYNEFISIQATFHQVCTSDFISDRWIEAIFSGSNSTYFFLLDFRTYGSAQFQALASFCRLSKASVIQSISLFGTTSFINLQVQSKIAFYSEVQGFIETFQLTAPNQFTTQLDLIREMIMRNRLFTGLQTNRILSYYRKSNGKYAVVNIQNGYVPDDEPLCTCDTDLDCGTGSYILNIFGEPTQMDYNDGEDIPLMVIPGIVSGCLPVNSLLSSTLECFYNQTCVDELLSFFSTTEQFTAMVQLENSRFEHGSTIKTIVDYLMVEEWITNISYDKYYEQCAPISCTYSKVERHDFWFVLTKLTRSLGGLTVILGLVIPLIIRFIRQPRNVESIPLSIRFHRIKIKSKKILIELNTFKHHGSNEKQVYLQRIGTRLYIIILVISLIILTFYSLLIKEIYHENVLNPTLSQYNRLQQFYSDSLSCPCTSISMHYSTFIHIEPQYHQVCSSDIISTEWINYISNKNLDVIYRADDYRTGAINHFQLLVMFCQKTRKIIDDALQVFFQTQFVSSQVFSQQVFESQINLSMYNWQSIITARFVHAIDLPRAMDFGNQLLGDSAIMTMGMVGNSVNIIVEAEKYGNNCSCALYSSCRSLFGIYDLGEVSFDTTPLFSIPNFFIGCFPIEGLFPSTLECFYNLSCMLEIDQYMYMPFGTFFNFSALDPNRNWPNETIESIINRLMVDSWYSNISFSSYYNACAPSQCTFEYMGRKNIFFVVMTIIGVFGGLSLGFKLSILIILRCIEKMMNHFSCVGLKAIIKNIFIFRTKNQTINRLHLILLVITLGIIYSLSTSTLQLTTVQITEPSLSTYQNLVKQFPNSLQCSCTHISMKYQTFLSIRPRFHQICSSEFVSNDWIEYLYNQNYYSPYYDPTDFRASAIGQFQLLISFCQLSQQTINDSLSQLMTSDLINSHLLSLNLLDDRLTTVINQLKFTTSNLFLDTINLIREMTGDNMIMSTLSTSWKFIHDTVIHVDWTIHTEPVVYDECNCGLLYNCTQSSNGMMAGCYPVEALLRTTLQCFYDQQCIDSQGTFLSLNISTLEMSRFNINTTIGLLLNQLMVEEYSINIYYERYFNQCAPSSCIYSYNEHGSTIEAIISLIDLYGGLVIITRCIAVIITEIYFYRKTRITPVMTSSNRE